MKNRRLDKALKKFELENMTVDGGSTILDVKKEIRAIADNYSDFADDVFEAGCTAVAMRYQRAHGHIPKIRIAILNTIGCMGLFVIFTGIAITPNGYQILGLCMIFVGCIMSSIFTIRGIRDAVRESKENGC